MARGYPDYWGQNANSFPIPTIGMQVWRNFGSGIAIPGGFIDVTTYTVLPGEVLYLAGGMVSCDAPGTQRYYIRIDAVDIGPIYYDLVSHLPLNPSALIEVLAGEVLRIRCTNLDIVGHNFTALLIGFRVTIVPDAAPAQTGLGVPIQGAGV